MTVVTDNLSASVSFERRGGGEGTHNLTNNYTNERLRRERVRKRRTGVVAGSRRSGPTGLAWSLRSPCPKTLCASNPKTAACAVRPQAHSPHSQQTKKGIKGKEKVRDIKHRVGRYVKSCESNERARNRAGGEGGFIKRRGGGAASRSTTSRRRRRRKGWGKREGEKGGLRRYTHHIYKYPT
jgi:hypothetical protein